MPIYSYDDYSGEHVITMTRAAPEWCNSDCPMITRLPDAAVPYMLRVNDGLILETEIPEVAKLFASFVAASALAYYRKYEGPTALRDTGYWRNFISDNTRCHGTAFVNDIVQSIQGA